VLRVLGIESSCDETGVALYSSEEGLLAQALHSQVAVHREFGGVVPELASRNHVQHIVPLVDSVLTKAGLNKTDIDAVAYTAGPGLVGALLVGASFAKSLSFALNIPAIAVHHLEAHLLAAKLDSPDLEFPFTALLVSGGHTQLFEARSLGNYALLGETLDDAVGEAFDKTAKLMGLAYPGGPLLAKLADVADEQACSEMPAFPRPMLNRPGFDFSFSGLKTSVRYFLQKNFPLNDFGTEIHNISASLQEAIVDVISQKSINAALKHNISQISISGGVSANSRLRNKLSENASKKGIQLFMPNLSYCLDNAAMIGFLASKKYKAKPADYVD